MTRPTGKIREARELDAVAHEAVQDVVALDRGGHGNVGPDEHRTGEGVQQGNLLHGGQHSMPRGPMERLCNTEGLEGSRNHIII